MMLAKAFQQVKETSPLIHNITNYVTVNDCANMLLACGASPIMADAIEEVEEITTICNGLLLNIGTLNSRTIASMHKAGNKANSLCHPICLDPVGAGASTLRTMTAQKLLHEINPAVVRGNISEIKALVSKTNGTKGVDAAPEDEVNEDSLSSILPFAKQFALEHHTILAITGAIDIVTDGNHAACIRNGHPLMSRVTGTGCMLSALTTAFIAANQSAMFDAVTAAVCTMGLCGEIAYSRLTNGMGNATYRNLIIDAAYCLTAEELERGAKVELR